MSDVCRKESEMRMRVQCASLVVARGSIGQPATAQSLGQIAGGTPTVDLALRADIERLMEVTGATALATQMTSSVSDALFNSVKRTHSVGTGGMGGRAISRAGRARAARALRGGPGRGMAEAFGGPERAPAPGQDGARYAGTFTRGSRWWRALPLI